MEYHDYVCSKCGHEVLSPGRPYPISWTDGHVCRFVLKQEKEAHDDRGQTQRNSVPVDRNRQS